MNPHSGHRTTVTIVDPHPHDYSLFDPWVERGSLMLHFFVHGRLALRRSPRHIADLWMINVQLLDISGLDLFEMLAGQLESVPVFIVTDTYRAEDEVRSLRLGATKYLCKPAALSWLATLRLPRRHTKETVVERYPESSAANLGYKPFFFSSLDDT